MTTVWRQLATDLHTDLQDHDGPLDDLVVGAGLTGLTTALLLARAGRRVAVVEARHVGAGTTGHSTAKVSLLQGTKLSRMLRHHTRHLVEAYVEGNLEGQQWLLRFCGDHGVDVQRRPAVTYAASSAQVSAARDEYEAASSVGLPVRWEERFDVPVPHQGGVVLDDQAQLDPVEVVHALTAQLREHGGLVHEGARVVEVSVDGRTATLDDGRVLEAGTIVLATGSPVLDRGLYFAKLEPQRSYVVVVDKVAAPHAMFLSAGSPGRSLREVPREGSSLLMVGGSGHVTGRADSERERLEELRAWTRAFYPGAVETHAWSAQDDSSPDGVPFVGTAPAGSRPRVRRHRLRQVGAHQCRRGRPQHQHGDPRRRAAVLAEAAAPPPHRPADRRAARATQRVRRPLGVPRVAGRAQQTAAHPPRRRPGAQRRRGHLGLPAARVALRPGRRGDRRPGDPAAEGRDEMRVVVTGATGNLGVGRRSRTVRGGPRRGGRRPPLPRGRCGKQSRRECEVAVGRPCSGRPRTPPRRR